MDTKTALLDAAEQAARANGHDGFSYGDLSKTIGISKASIHHHFPSKANLIETLMGRYQTVVADEFNSIDAMAQNAGQRLCQFINIYRIALNGGESLCLCVALSIGRDGLEDTVKRQLYSFRELGLAWLKDVFESGAVDGSIKGVIDAASEAATCLAIVEGAQLAARAEHNEERFEQAVCLLLRRIVD